MDYTFRLPETERLLSDKARGLAMNPSGNTVVEVLGLAGHILCPACSKMIRGEPTELQCEIRHLQVQGFCKVVKTKEAHVPERYQKAVANFINRLVEDGVIRAFVLAMPVFGLKLASPGIRPEPDATSGRALLALLWQSRPDLFPEPMFMEHRFGVIFYFNTVLTRDELNERYPGECFVQGGDLGNDDWSCFDLED